MDEDDGQIARELVPVDEAFMRKDEEGAGTALGLEQKCNSVSKLCSQLSKCNWIKQAPDQVFI